MYTLVRLPVRQVVLARFGARVPPGDATAEQLLVYLLRYYHEGGTELALLWLNALFVQVCPLPQPLRQSTPAATPAAGDGGAALAEAKEYKDGKEWNERPVAETVNDTGMDVADGKVEVEGGPGGDVSMADAAANGGAHQTGGGAGMGEATGLAAAAGARSQHGAEGSARTAAAGVAAAGGSSSAGSNGGSGSVDATSPPDLSGTTYETVLLALLERAR